MVLLGSVTDFLLGGLLYSGFGITRTVSFSMGGVHFFVGILILYFSNLLRLKTNNNCKAEVIKFFRRGCLVWVILEIIVEIIYVVLVGFWLHKTLYLLGIALLVDFLLFIMTALGFYAIVRDNLSLVSVYIYLKVIVNILIVLVSALVLAVFRLKNLILDFLLYVVIILFNLDFFVFHLNVMMMTRSADIKRTSDLQPSPPSDTSARQ